MKPTLAPEWMLLICFLITVVLQVSFFFIAFRLQFDKVTDLAGTLNFLLLALITLFVQSMYTTRSIIVTCLITAWSIRLGAFLLKRVLNRGKDERFDRMRKNCLAFFGFWVFQIFWVFLVSLPVILLNSGDHMAPKFGKARDIVGIIIWTFGFLVEWTADSTKERFYNSSKNRVKLLQHGLWKYSRHPNYFGEILCWIGIVLIASQCFVRSQNWFYCSTLSPIFTFCVLMFLSGIPMSEERYDMRFGLDASYLEYKRTTSPLILLPTSVYGSFPLFIKRAFFFEFPMYSKKLNELLKQQRNNSRANR